MGNVVIITLVTIIFARMIFPGTYVRLVRPGSLCQIYCFSSALLHIENTTWSRHICVVGNHASRLHNLQLFLYSIIYIYVIRDWYLSCFNFSAGMLDHVGQLNQAPPPATVCHSFWNWPLLHRDICDHSQLAIHPSVPNISQLQQFQCQCWCSHVQFAQRI